MTVRSEKVTFPGASGATLAANLERPAGTPRAYALFAHCFTCSKDNFAASRIARALAERGIAVLRFDFTGLGHSEGEFANTDFSSNVGDLVAAGEWLRANHVPARLLIGHSLGGAAATMAAAQLPEALAVAMIGAPADLAALRRMLGAAYPEIERAGESEVEIGGRKFRVRRQFLEDLDRHRLPEAVVALQRPLLIFHAPDDTVVGIGNAEAIFAAARHPKSFVALDGADHLLARKADAAYVADILGAWSSRYLGSGAGMEEPSDQAEAAEVVVGENGVGRFGQDVAVGPHLFHADEPPSAGGRNSGPTPYQLLSAALGACTSMTMRMYADHKKWPLRRARVMVRHDKIHAADCENCETREGKIDRFVREITLDGPLDAEQRQRILAIADKCPVHRTLKSEVEIRTILRE